MSNSRWLPLVAVILFVAVGLGVLTLWSFGVLRSAKDDAGSKPPRSACEPAMPAGAERPKDCP